jgi:DNA recombination protein RmuC
MEGRTELNNSLKDFRAEVKGVLEKLTIDNTSALERINKTFAEQVAALIQTSEKSDATRKVDLQERFNGLTEQAKNDATQTREALTAALKTFQQTFDQSVKSFNELQREKFGQLETKQGELIQSTEKKLDEMRATVDEKLQKTLTERIGQSFEMVGKQLENVQKGLGEMQSLAQDVGGLKKVLSNVKMRGGYGEVQLAMLLEQVLAPEQYEANVKTKVGSNDTVEFAIKLPGRDDASSVVYLPVDAKFPKDAYEQLLSAYELGDTASIEQSAKAYEDRVKSMAKSIHDKYIDPPNTTDFAIMFLPFESMYAEVIRKPALVEALQRDFKVLVVGPMNLAGLLNSLQMGFRTLAIQQRASEVWQVLGAVKTEFDNFGGLLEKAQKNLATASNQIEEVVGRRTRAIKRKLKDVQALPAAESQALLPDAGPGDVLDEDEP